MMFRRISLLLPLLFACHSAQAAPVRIYANVSSPMNDVSYDAGAQAVRSGPLTVVLHVTCFGTNLRSVPYPLARNSHIRFQAEIDSVAYNVSFPGGVTQKAIYTGTTIPASDIQLVEPAGLSGAADGNTVYIRSPQNISLTIESDGSYSPVDRSNLVRNVRFKQHLPKAQASVTQPSSNRTYANYRTPRPHFTTSAIRDFLSLFTGFFRPAHAGWGGIPDDPYPDDSGDAMGYDRALTAHYSYEWSTDFRTLEINAAFPGQVGYCGGYVSPLMLFFDESRPRFTNTIDFNMGSHLNTFWPEKGAPGYFLAIDKNRNGQIDDVFELFGSVDDSSNGFETLREYDTNKDQLIDSRDPKFSQLLLWSDRNGDGISQPDEIGSLNDMGVVSISLRYRADQREYLGTRAEIRERSKFKYRRGSKLRTADIVDVWLSSTGR